MENQRSAELRKLIGDIRNQLQFLGELGIESLETSLDVAPKITQITEPIAAEIRAPEIPAILKGVTSPPPIRPSIVPRSHILASSRLSNRPSQQNLIEKNPSVKNEMAKSNNEKEIAPALPIDLAPVLQESLETLDAIRKDIGDCKRCELCKERTQIVHSEGDARVKLMFVGEAPGADEDAQGRPFVGRAGQLLTKIIEAIGLKREDVFIGNINRCRPPGNRQPTLIEAQTCRPFLLREIAVVRPKIIVVMGNTACQNLLETKTGISKLRGSFHDYFGVKVMPTFHPAYLLRDPSKKREVWDDMKKVRAELDR